MMHATNEIGEGVNEIYYCPLMKARITLKGNNQEKYNKDNFKNRKQYIERPVLIVKTWILHLEQIVTGVIYPE